MKKLKYGIAILIVLICLVFPVSADLLNGYYRVAPNINQGATVFIGEQGLDISPALAAANAVGDTPLLILLSDGGHQLLISAPLHQPFPLTQPDGRVILP